MSRLMDHSSLDGSFGVSSDCDVAEPTYRALWQSTSVCHGILDPGATRTYASVDSLERYWLALTQASKDHEMQVTPGSHSVFRFGDGLSEVVVLLMREPLGRQ